MERIRDEEDPSSLSSIDNNNTEHDWQNWVKHKRLTLLTRQ
jgi:hypothetical protein